MAWLNKLIELIMSIKNQYNTVVLAVLILIAGLVSVEAQKKPRRYFRPAPTRLMLPGDENERKDADRADLLREHFYPIGWSKDGKFAYLVEPADEACGCYLALFIIQDMRTDKILWEKAHEGSDQIEESLVTFWRANRREFSDRLDQYGILAPKFFVLEKTAFNYQGDALNTRLDVNVKNEDAFSPTGNVILQLISKKSGKKTIYEEKISPEQTGSFMDAELGGVLVAPFEARAAVVIIEKHRGWEGPPHTTRLRVIGAHLTDGFR